MTSRRRQHRSGRAHLVRIARRHSGISHLRLPVLSDRVDGNMRKFVDPERNGSGCSNNHPVEYSTTDESGNTYDSSLLRFV